MKFVLFVDHEIGHRLLGAALDLRSRGLMDILAIVTTQENGSKWWPGVEPVAARAAIPFFRFDPSNTGFLADVAQADYFLLLSWKHLMPPSLLAIPRRGTINLHYSLLPAFRGVYPVNWAITSGHRTTGVSFHWVDSGIDAGPVFSQQAIDIQSHDTAKTLQRRMDDVALCLFHALIAQLAAESPIARPAASGGTRSEYYSRARFLATNEVDLDQTVRTGDFIDFLRGKSFYPEGRNAYFVDPSNGRKVFLHLLLEPEESTPDQGSRLPPPPGGTP